MNIFYCRNVLALYHNFITVLSMDCSILCLPSRLLDIGQLPQAATECKSESLHPSSNLHREDVLCEHERGVPLGIQHIHVLHGLRHQAEGTPDFCRGTGFGKSSLASFVSSETAGSCNSCVSAPSGNRDRKRRKHSSSFLL